MRTATIVVADTHQLFAHGLRRLLEVRDGLTVVDLVTDGFAALEACRQHNPDLLIVDAGIPGLDSLEICRQLRRFSSHTRVMLTMPCIQHERLSQAIQLGASAVVLKSAGVNRLYTSIDAVLGGGCDFPAEAGAGQGTYISMSTRTETPYSRLTARERTIFKLLAEGHSVKQVASQLELKPKTVDVHKTNLMRKLDVHDRSELIHFAFREGLVAPAVLSARP